LSSFALHYAFVGEERDFIVNWLYENVDLVLLFEFDVNDQILSKSVFDEERFKYILAKFEM
jgi:hypothetical protein